MTVTGIITTMGYKTVTINNSLMGNVTGNMTVTGNRTVTGNMTVNILLMGNSGGDG